MRWLDAGHPRDLAGNAALLPLQPLAELEGAQPTVRYVGEVDQHVVVGESKAGTRLELAVEPGGQVSVRVEPGPPGTLLAGVQPSHGVAHEASLGTSR